MHTEADKTIGALPDRGAPFMRFKMDILLHNLLAAAEACFEAEPSPLNDSWCDRISTTFVPLEVKKEACTTHVPHKETDEIRHTPTKSKPR